MKKVVLGTFFNEIKKFFPKNHLTVEILTCKLSLTVSVAP